MSDLQTLLTRLAQNRPGQQLGMHAGVTYFRSLSRKHGGWTYEVHDVAQGKEVPLASPLTDERRFVTASRSYWRYRLPRTEAPIVDVSTLEQQLAASEFVAQGHGLDPR